MLIGRTFCRCSQQFAYILLLFNLIVIRTFVVGKDNFVQLYEKGVEAYLENSFEDCVVRLEKSVRLYRTYTKALQFCRLKCRNEVEYFQPSYPINIEDLFFYEKTLHNTLCIVKCRRERPEVFEELHVNREIEELFQQRKPYEYLQACYFRTKQLQKAASAAFTYLVVHPDNKVMLATLKQYSKLDKVDMNEIINYEAKDFVYSYIHGADDYANKNWQGVIINMEESISSYLQAEDECRADCEGPFDPGWYPDFIPAISNHFTFSLKCKRKCKKTLASLNGEVHEDLLPSHYHYLQFAYFKLGKLRDACEAVANYLLFFPNDETMLNNMKFYRSMPKATDEYFTPSHEAIRYVQREHYEGTLLKFINSQFNFTKSTPEDSSWKNYRVVLTAKQLRGQNRFVADGVATRHECKTLVEIAKTFAELGEGYDGRKSPHTTMEKWLGLSLSRTTLLTYFGLISKRTLKLYLNLTELVRQKVTNYFGVNKPLHFSFTQIVCRAALKTSTENRTDFSHAIHADNCNVQTDGSCEKTEPSYTWRDYSAILYLNEDFEGGQFVFANDSLGNNIESEVPPKCGRLVGFSSGGDNLHGVKAVKKGSRCAIGLWFTFDDNHTESDRLLAQNLLEQNIVFEVKNPFE